MTTHLSATNKKGHGCQVEMVDQIRVFDDQFITGHSTIKMTSPNDPDCQKSRTVTQETKSQFKVDGDLLHFYNQGPVKRVSDLPDMTFCQKGRLVGTYKRK